MDAPKGSELIYDWNLLGDHSPFPAQVLITDETLRDGLQSPSIIHPALEDKLRILHLMRDLGVDAADLGLCGAGERFKNDVTRLAREIVDRKMLIQPQSAARTLEADIAPIVDASEQAGIPIEACIFIGSSPIRQYAEGWTLDRLLELAESAVAFAVGHGLPVMFVTEDTTRARPDHLRQLYSAAMRAGARRICVADTVGHATPDGVRNLVRFVKGVVDEVNPEVGVDWHGHKDRGMDIINNIAALEAGADRLHACALGIGERSGNTPMELLLVNLNLMGISDRDLHKLPDYCELVSRVCGAAIPFNYPVVGADAFRTATGVHAAAVVKAVGKEDNWLADRVYCGVPASMVGREQGIEIGPMSGEHNVRFWMIARGLETHPALVQKILEVAKLSSRLLGEAETRRMVQIMEQRRVRGDDLSDLSAAGLVQLARAATTA
ncbi:MAG: 2-isopropylmalate synthase [Chloroflexi bacterium]|nr:2-isopropylmalate synthase [Chloroflexota bacterium]